MGILRVMLVQRAEGECDGRCDVVPAVMAAKSYRELDTDCEDGEWTLRTATYVFYNVFELSGDEPCGPEILRAEIGDDVKPELIWEVW